MAKQPVHRTIDDREYEFFPLAPQPAIKILTRVIKVVGEPIGLAVDGLTALKDGDGKALKLSAILDLKTDMLPKDLVGKVMASLTSKLDEDEVFDTIKALVMTAHVKAQGDNGTRQIVFDRDFAGHTGHLLKVFAAAMEVHYGDFFGAGGGVLASLSAKGMTPASPT